VPDVAVVGAGPAGVATAYFLRDSGADVTVLEAGDDVGGRTLSVPVGGVPSSTGALFVYRGTPAEELATELGIRTVPFSPDTYGIHVNGATVVDEDNDRLIDRLPISPTAREQLRAFVRTSLDEYALYTRGGRLTDDADSLSGHTVADRLRGLEPDAKEIITRAIRGGSVADPGQLSAQYALRYFASYLAHERHSRLYPVDGMQTIVRAMADRLKPGTVRPHARVDRVAFDRATDSYALTLAGEPDPVRARHVVVAVPAPITRRIVADLPAWKGEALAETQVPGSTTLCVTADITGLPHVAKWAFVTITGRPFDAVINPHPVGPGSAVELPATAQFVCYGNSAGYRPDLAADPAGTRAWVEEFLAVAPELRGRVLGAHLQTWEHCFAILTPERARAVPQLQQSIGRLHFAGDHTSDSAGTHGAYGEARRVADLIEGTLHDVREDGAVRRDALRNPDAGHHRRSAHHPG
jgi:monoamine oxidase